MQAVFRTLESGDYPRATREAARLAAKFPKNPDIQHNAGQILMISGDPGQAAIYLERAVKLLPENENYYPHLVWTLILSEQFLKAKEWWNEAVGHFPSNNKLMMIGSVLEAQSGTFERSFELAKLAYEGDPSGDGNLENYYDVWSTRDPKAAFSFLLKAIGAVSDQTGLRMKLAMDSLYLEDIAEDEVRDLFLDVRDSFASIEHDAKPFSNDLDAIRKLKIGIISPDLRRHSVSHFLMPIVENLDRNNFEIHLYPLNGTEDEVTKKLRSGTKWSKYVFGPPKELSDRIRRDEIDILLETGGITQGSAPEVLAIGSAPIQISLIGFPFSTGVPKISGRLGDHFVDIPEQEKFALEPILRMEPPFLCYSSDIPYPDLIPRAADQQVVFCSLNNPRKIGIRLLNVWKRILDQVPGALLLLKSNQVNRPIVLECLMQKVEEIGLSGRVIFQDALKQISHHRAVYFDADIALDTFPYHGTTTTFEALLMGVPVVTRMGLPHRSRVSAMILQQIGKQDWIADDEDEYVQIAVRLAGEVESVRASRSELRSLVEKSAVMDGPEYGQKLGDAIRAVWVDECRR